jgi:AcrR family transcriptional regulator
MTPDIARPGTEELTPAGRRILDTASRLFYEHGIRAVGVEMIASEANVTKKTIYDRFGSKDALIQSYLEERDRHWRQVLTTWVEQEGLDPRGRILAIFNALDDWMESEMQRRGCSFINAYAELAETDHPARPVIEGQKRWLHNLFQKLLSDAGIAETDALATRLLLLHEGAYVTYAIMGRNDAAHQARLAAETLFDAATVPR